MTSDIKIFKNEMFGEVRTLTNEKGETFFVGKDVADALGYTNTPKAIRDHVDDDDKLTERFVLSGQTRFCQVPVPPGMIESVRGLPPGRLFVCAIDVIDDELCGIFLAQVVHRDYKVVVTGVVAGGVLVLLDVCLAGGVHLFDNLARLL